MNKIKYNKILETSKHQTKVYQVTLKMCIDKIYHVHYLHMSYESLKVFTKNCIIYIDISLTL